MPTDSAYPVIDLNTAFQWRAYKAEALVKVGVSGPHLLIPANRKRLQPIVVEVDTDLLHQLLTLRGEVRVDKVADLQKTNRELVERNARQAETILSQSNRLREAKGQLDELKGSLRPLSDQLRAVEAQVALVADAAKLREACTERDEKLTRLQENFESERDAVFSLKRRCERMGEAIRKVLLSSKVRALGQLAHDAFRNALVSEGFHPQTSHGFFSWPRWFGCPHCVPEWQLYPSSELSEGQTFAARAVEAVWEREVAAVLRPALEPEKMVVRAIANHTIPNAPLNPNVAGPEVVTFAVVDPGASGTAAADDSATA